MGKLRLVLHPRLPDLNLRGLHLCERGGVRPAPPILFFPPAGLSPPPPGRQGAEGRGLTVLQIPAAAAVQEIVMRSLPQLVVIDADGSEAAGLELCARLKADSYSAIVPLAAVATRHTTNGVKAWFAAGADQVITPLFEPAEQVSRLDGLVTRTARDLAVNPSTPLPGTTEIEREIRRRMEAGGPFAACYVRPR